MSYTVLARRYRSTTFDEVIGQGHIAQTIKKAIASGRIAHAYLFCGTRGTGKTSTARILAKALNCESSDGPSPEPCNKCASCLATARGEDIDVIEIDAASNTGVDNVRVLIENSQYRPARSRFKVYIIDEVHMLSKQAFNALLKTLEEPPSHVKFILATTEPEKVLQTILSRCQRYDFRNIPTREIAAHLADISKKEKINADEDALLLVAKAGAGSMRDALSLLDRLLSVGEKKLTVELIEQMLGLPRTQVIFALVEAIGAGDVKGVLEQADAIVQSGLSVDTLIATLVEHLRNLLVLRSCGSQSNLVEVPGLALAELVKQAERFEVSVLVQDMAVLEELRRQARQSQAGRALLDATLVRLALAEQFSTVAELLDRVNGLPATRPAAGAAAQKKKHEPVEGAAAVAMREAAAPVERAAGAPAPTPIRETPVQAALPVAPASLAPASLAPASLAPASLAPASLAPASLAPASLAPASMAPVVQPGPDLDDDDDLPAPGKVWEGPSVSLGTLMKQHTAAQDAAPSQAAPPSSAQVATSPAAAASSDVSNVEAVNVADLSGTWKALLALLAKEGPGLGGLLAHGRFVGVEDGRAVVRYDRAHETFLKMLERNGKKDAVRDAFSQLLNQNVGVRFELDPEIESPPAAPPQQTARAPEAAPRAAAPPPVAVPIAPVVPSIRLTPEVMESLRADPIVKAVMEALGGSIVKVEESQ